jgi:hypothetical protein
MGLFLQFDCGRLSMIGLEEYRNRDVAQPGSALRSGRRSRRFESCHPDQRLAKPPHRGGFCFWRGAAELVRAAQRKKQKWPEGLCLSYVISPTFRITGGW